MILGHRQTIRILKKFLIGSHSPPLVAGFGPSTVHWTTPDASSRLGAGSPQSSLSLQLTTARPVLLPLLPCFQGIASAPAFIYHKRRNSKDVNRDA